MNPAQPIALQDRPVASRRKVSIVVPCHNESEAIPELHAALLGLFAQLSDYDFEVICVDDGSADNTAVQLVALARSDRRFHVIELSRNFGKIRAHRRPERGDWRCGDSLRCGSAGSSRTDSPNDRAVGCRGRSRAGAPR